MTEMTKEKPKTLHLRGRHVVGFVLIVLAVASTPFIGYVIVPLGLAFYVSMLLIMLLWSPAFLFLLYILYWMMSPLPEGTRPRDTIKGFRQWAGFYVFLVLGILYYGLLAFIFDTLTPNLSMGYRVTILPLVVIAITVLILTLTRLKRFIERIIWGNSDK